MVAVVAVVVVVVVVGGGGSSGGGALLSPPPPIAIRDIRVVACSASRGPSGNTATSVRPIPCLSPQL